MANRKREVYKPKPMTEGKRNLIQDMLETEMDNHLGYDRYERSGEPNYRNGTKPQVLPKRQKDISSIDDKIISMYAKGMTTRQISETLEDIYGFEASEGMVQFKKSS